MPIKTYLRRKHEMKGMEVKGHKTYKEEAEEKKKNQKVKIKNQNREE